MHCLTYSNLADTWTLARVGMQVLEANLSFPVLFQVLINHVKIDSCNFSKPLSLSKKNTSNGLFCELKEITYKMDDT